MRYFSSKEIPIESASEKILKRCENISPAEKAAFISALLFGFLVHIIAITGWIFNWDTTLIEPRGWLISQGKWASDLVYALDAGDYTIAMSRITALISIGLASMLLVNIFAVRNKFWAGLIGACMASFPSIMCAFSYGAVGFWGVTLVILSLWVAWKYHGWVGFVFSASVLAFALGVYQPHIGFAASGMVLLCILELLKEENSPQKIFFNAVRYVAVLALGILLYYILLKLFLHGQPLGDYQNISGIDHITFSGIWSGIHYAYSSFFSMFLFDGYGTGYSYIILAYRTMFILTVIGIIFLTAKCKLYKKPLKLVLMAIFVFLYPMAVHAVAVLSQGAPSHWIMMYSFVMLPVTFIVVAYRCELAMKDGTFSAKDFVTHLCAKSGQLYQWCCCLCCFLLLYCWSITTNEGYLRLRITYEGAYQQMTDIVDDIYESEEYQNGCTTILLFNGGWPTVYNSMPQYSNYTGIAYKSYLYHFPGIGERFLTEILEIPFSYATAEQKESIICTPKFQNMPCYPKSGYIQEVNGILVVKM